MTFSVATWNINSVRLRIDNVTRFLRDEAPDVLCLQETKCRDAEFPHGEFHKAGYAHIAIHGQQGYHGVAIVSRLPLENVQRREFCAKGDARHVSATLSTAGRKMTVHNFYVPAGGDEPDVTINPKFAHKLDFLDEMRDWFASDKVAGGDAMLMGDLNIAPLEHDVWSHKALLKVVSHTPVEVERLGQVQASGPWFDALRARVPEAEKLYTWWSYRSPDWDSADKGRRLDHIWLSHSLAPHLQDMRVLRAARGWERPSDHAPVLVRMAL
ncbi:MAG: exodeoxyribonuclease III [Hyphomicrobiales bacterium]|nr:exodeoxyribonuclease III [Hyphomicrobiales bacterium]MDE2113363.1 exodeoxyribonuclease III [Hyphomicrobiales bacterium]